ncbi:MAG TPA: hypothetical protein VF384_14015 [Planctomycetota bacterium]
MPFDSLARVRSRTHSSLRPRRLAASLALAAIAASALPAQCEPDWQDGAPAPGPDGTVNTLVPLPNGQVFAGGVFRVADGAIANNAAVWVGTNWHALGNGPGIAVRCAVLEPNGDLLVGGSGGIRRWDGTTWSQPAPGLGGTVACLLVLPTGEVIAGGALSLPVAPGTIAVATWNGTAWSTLGTNTPAGSAQALARLANGDIVAAGTFTTFPAHGLERWDGTSWQPIAGLDPTVNSMVHDAVVRTNGDLVFSGSFRIQGVDGVLATWDGTTMQLLQPPLSLPRKLLAAANGDVVVGGTDPANNLARWTGASWQTLSNVLGQVTHLAEDASGSLLVGMQPQAPFLHRVRRFSGTAWQDLGGEAPPKILAMVRLPKGEVIAGGTFTSLDGIPAANIAHWNGVAWSPLGLGVDWDVTSLAVAPNGDVIAGGRFFHAGGVAASNIARWDGSRWSPLGAGLPVTWYNGGVAAIAVAGNGDVYATVANGLARFDGLQWTNVPFPSTLAAAEAMVTDADGDVLVAGTFFGFGPQATGVLRVQGTTMTAIPGAPLLATSAFRAADHSVIFSSLSGLHRWDGHAWSTLPAMGHPVQIDGIAQLPNGELIACGTQHALGGTSPSCLFRLRPTGWKPWSELTVGTGRSVVATPRGEVFVAGDFETAGNVVCCGLARSLPTCPATSSVVGAGCSGGAGLVTLAADNGAWIGTTFRATAHGMAASPLAIQVLGVQGTAVPLPGGVPGCSLFVLPLLTGVLLPSGDLAAAAFALPDQLALAGLQFRLQVVGIELSGPGSVQLTSTNALQVTIGAL